MQMNYPIILFVRDTKNGCKHKRENTIFASGRQYWVMVWRHGIAPSVFREGKSTSVHVCVWAVLLFSFLVSQHCEEEFASGIC